MKNQITLAVLGGILCLTACSPIYNYQVFNHKSLDEKNIISFENEDIRVEYNFWADGGQLGITVLNKTTAPLYLDLSQSALVVNDVAMAAYQEIEIGSIVSAARSRSVSYFNMYGFLEAPGYSKSVSYSKSFRTTPVVFLPPKAQSVSTLLPGQLVQRYRGPDANLKSREEEKSLAFNKERSPFSFRFTLGYSTHKDLQNIKFIEDEFWVDSITILRESKFLGKLIHRYRSTTLELYSLPYKKKNAAFVKYQVGGGMQH